MHYTHTTYLYHDIYHDTYIVPRTKKYKAFCVEMSFVVPFVISTHIYAHCICAQVENINDKTYYPKKKIWFKRILIQIFNVAKKFYNYIIDKERKKKMKKIWK